MNDQTALKTQGTPSYTRSRECVVNAQVRSQCLIPILLQHPSQSINLVARDVTHRRVSFSFLGLRIRLRLFAPVSPVVSRSSLMRQPSMIFAAPSSRAISTRSTSTISRSRRSIARNAMRVFAGRTGGTGKFSMMVSTIAFAVSARRVTNECSRIDLKNIVLHAISRHRAGRCSRITGRVKSI